MAGDVPVQINLTTDVWDRVTEQARANGFDAIDLQREDLGPWDRGVVVSWWLGYVAAGTRRTGAAHA